MIEIRNLKKSYDNESMVLNGIDLDIKNGEFVVLLGPSGCGKTTLLKSINKMIDTDSGEILVDGRSIKEWDTTTLRRSIGYVIQQIGLFPHMNVKDNINYVLSLKKENKNKTHMMDKRATELIKLVGMEEDILRRYPRELSGGQKQRIGVARALASNPKIILMDEPFGAVDEIARTILQDELKELQKRLHKTIIFVTHDIEEALKLGSKIVLMKDGNIEQSGTAKELLFSPKTDFVKKFLGLKGFKSILEDKKIKDIYEDILMGKINLDDSYERLK